ncbi:hypothetical protein T4E_10704, partial [Trichinella pseudospiralis]
MESEKVLIQLNGENYSWWKFEIEAVLEARDCLDVVSGETTCPQKHAFIRSCKTSKEMMNCIVRIKEQAT